jgi:cell division protein ZapA
VPQISVSIDGRSYRMACGEGEEAHLAGLAETLDARIAEMRKSFGEIGDMRLQVMAAITIVDEMAELRGRLAALEAEVADLRAVAAAAERGRADEAERAAAGIDRAAERLGRLTDALGGGATRL